MKRVLILALVLGVAAIAWYQAGPPSRPLAQVLPGGALLCLEAKNFSQLLAEWDSSNVKRDWLVSANYSEFERSNLYIKLNGFYKAYGSAAGFALDMASLRTLAGDQSALALYDLHGVQFAYITRLTEAKAAQSRLWLARGAFESRQAAGVTFYTKTSGDVELAFAVAHGYLAVSSGEERMAGMLGLLAGKDTPNIAGESWYKNSTEAAGAPGELRLTMNLESMVENTYFRSYWVQRNVSDVRRYSSGVADIHRSSNEIREQRLFLKKPGQMEQLPQAEAIAEAAVLTQLAPDDAGLYRVWAAPAANDAASLIESHILNPRPGNQNISRYAPMEDGTAGAGSETDLETRIDLPPLPSAAKASDTSPQLFASNDLLAMLQVQSSKALPSSPFIALPCAVALVSRTRWNVDRVKEALGGEWTAQTRGAFTIYRAGGLGQIAFAADGPLLIIASDADLLKVMLDRHATGASSLNATYAAFFRHNRERANFGRMMTALDFSQTRADQAPPFFSGNIASLSAALRRVTGLEVVERTTADRVEQRVVYRLAPQ